MNKIILIIKREYLTRVKKRSFIIMTILGPILMAALFIVPVYIAELEGETKLVGIIDETGLFYDKFRSTENIKFITLDSDLETAKQNITNEDLYAILYIPKTELSVPQSGMLYSAKQPNIVVKGYIKNIMRKEVEALKLSASGVDPDILKSIKTNINLFTIKMSEGGEEEKSSTELSMAVGFICGILIYIFIFMYGALVMRGVIEEKTNRIVEVIVSSVKPFQLMMGKIVGVAMVGLTQFALWVIFTLIIVSTFMSFFSDEISSYQSSQLKIHNEMLPVGVNVNGGEIPSENIQNTLEGGDINESVISIFESIQSINFEVVILSFLFFFIGGYFLYGALFAAIGSAVDSETDTQQFMLPITVPLILSIVLSQFIMNNPDGPAAFWLSIFPLTSPVIMMIRIPFGVPYTDLYLSIVLMILGFLGATWLAGKIYRTGILMYGKKINYKELWKWITYKN
ncbi:MAG: ABC transporter permease [Bacteroidetes bacterium]|nr:ABC transporter permease [Bacteroidota bacterium]MBL7103018.1 ABC transporter permease [Bacteroidales bacterium]